MEDSFVWRTLSYGGLFRMEDSFVWRTLSYGGLFRMEDSFIWRTLSYGGLFRMEELSGALFRGHLPESNTLGQDNFNS